MSEAQQDRQRLKISVQNREGFALAGAQVRIFYNGDFVGELTSAGESYVEFDDLEGLALEASGLGVGNSARAAVARGQEEVVLVLPTNRFIELATVPTATCPDGTTGQPCVTCQVARRRIRICG